MSSTYRSSLWIIISTAMFCRLQLSKAETNETDRLALLAIRAKITHDPSSVMSSWNDTLHFCRWQGVTCGRKHERVTYLDLPSSQLTGIISPYVGNLTFLKGLRLQNNSFGGTIPSEIGRLHRLQYLFIRNNSIEGAIPSNISGCSSLIAFDIFGNKLEGEIPPQIGFLPNLKAIFLSHNNFIGNIPSSMGNLSSLSKLYMDYTNLIGNIPPTFGNLKNLTEISLSGYNLSGTIPPSIFNLSLLVHLDVGGNNFEGSLPAYLGNTLPNLRWLSISRNRFTGIIPDSIVNCSNLESLLLGGNNLQGQVPSLHKLLKLQRLTLFQNSLGYGQEGDLSFVSSLSNATMLEYFEIGDNNFKGSFPRALCNFSMIKTMSIYSNYIDGEIPNCIENLVFLQSFAVFDNALSGVIPQAIGKLQKLNKLFLNDNKFSGALPSSIGNLTELTVFTLANNSLEGQIPDTLQNCISLLGLNFSQNSFSGEIPSVIFSLPTLTVLILSGNHLTGSLPEEVGQLKNLGTLDVSNNMLSGQIPSTLSSCLSLESLNMSHNSIQGIIPNGLQTLKGLLWLDLSYNNISGQIPNFLANIELQGLDLSHNYIEGGVPTSGVFTNTTSVSLTGNTKLCGGIPALKLSQCNVTHNTHKRRLKHKKVMIIAILCGLLAVILLGALIVLCILPKRKRSKEPTTFDELGNFPNLSYQTLLKATNGFASENLIGRGTFGVVYKGRINEDGPEVAIKIFNLEYPGASKSFMAECEFLRNIKHRNLVKVITACSSIDYKGRDFKALIYEYMVNGSLEDWLHASRNLNLLQRLDIAVDVASAMDYLHHHCGTPIVHCDLKPSNVLLDEDMVAHVGDFGLAKFLQKAISTAQESQSSSIGVRGTIGYTPPEYGLGYEVSTNGDVYSFGILLLEIFTGKKPTNDMFKGGHSLHEFVNEYFPKHVTNILDSALLEDIKGEDRDTNALLEALTTILGIGLSCSSDIPQERLSMSDVSTQLSSLRTRIVEHLTRRY